MDKPYQQLPILHNLYVVQHWTDGEIAEYFDVSRSTVTHWRNKYGIDGRTPSDYASRRPAGFYMTADGYEYFHSSTCDEDMRVYHHRLLAVLDHTIEDLKDAEVHHKNEIPWDNREDNIEVLKASEHKALHADERRNEQTGRLQ